MAKHVATSREYSRNSKSNEYLSGILIVILGLVIVYCGAGMINTIVMATGVLLILLGVLTYAQYKATDASIAQMIIGAVFLILGYYGLAADLVRILVGITIILAGLGIILGTRNSFFIFTVNTKNAAVQYILGAVVIILGVLSLINYYDCFGWTIRIVGAIIAAAGVISLCMTAGLIKRK